VRKTNDAIIRLPPGPTPLAKSAARTSDRSAQSMIAPILLGWGEVGREGGRELRGVGRKV
jgi:hypothetical protein